MGLAGVQHRRLAGQAAHPPGMAGIAGADRAAEPLLGQGLGLQQVPQVEEVGVHAEVVDHVLALHRQALGAMAPGVALHEHLRVVRQRRRQAGVRGHEAQHLRQPHHAGGCAGGLVGQAPVHQRHAIGLLRDLDERAHDEAQPLRGVAGRAAEGVAPRTARQADRRHRHAAGHRHQRAVDRQRDGAGEAHRVIRGQWQPPGLGAGLAAGPHLLAAARVGRAGRKPAQAAAGVAPQRGGVVGLHMPAAVGDVQRQRRGGRQRLRQIDHQPSGITAAAGPVRQRLADAVMHGVHRQVGRAQLHLLRGGGGQQLQAGHAHQLAGRPVQLQVERQMLQLHVAGSAVGPGWRGGAQRAGQAQAGQRLHRGAGRVSHGRAPPTRGTAPRARPAPARRGASAGRC